MAEIFAVRKKKALRYLIDQNNLIVQQNTEILNCLQALIRQGTKMDDQLTAIQNDLDIIKPILVTALQTIPALQAQNALLLSKVSTDDADVAAGQAQIQTLTDQLTASQATVTQMTTDETTTQQLADSLAQIAQGGTTPPTTDPNAPSGGAPSAGTGSTPTDGSTPPSDGSTTTDPAGAGSPTGDSGSGLSALDTTAAGS